MNLVLLKALEPTNRKRTEERKRATRVKNKGVSNQIPLGVMIKFLELNRPL